MTQFEDTPIRTRQDGSIDIEYYIQKGHHERSLQACKMIKGSADPAPKASKPSLWNALFGTKPA